MKELQEILKYTKDLVEQEPEKSSYWHYNKLVSKIEEVIDVIQCCKSDSEQLPNMTLEQAIAKAKPNLDKITDVDRHLEDIR